MQPAKENVSQYPWQMFLMERGSNICGQPIYHLRCHYLPDWPLYSVTDTDIVYNTIVEVCEEKFGSTSVVEVHCQKNDYEPDEVPYDVSSFEAFDRRFGFDEDCGYTLFAITRACNTHPI